MDSVIKNILDAMARELLEVLAEIDDADSLTVYVNKSGHYEVIAIEGDKMDGDPHED